MAEQKPYRDDERAANERAAELERELEAAHVHSSDETTRPGRKEIEAQLADTWARQFDAQVHRGAIVKVVPRPRWVPQPKTAEDRAASGLLKKRLLVGLGVVLAGLVVGGLVYAERQAQKPDVIYDTFR